MFGGLSLDNPTPPPLSVAFQKATAPNSKLRGCFDLRDESVREMRDQDVVPSRYIPRDINISDMLTHCLSGPKFRKCLERAQNLRTYSCRGACEFEYSHSYNCGYGLDEYYLV
jgi:hypothetical protein